MIGAKLMGCLGVLRFGGLLLQILGHLCKTQRTYQRWLPTRGKCKVQSDCTLFYGLSSPDRIHVFPCDAMVTWGMGLRNLGGCWFELFSTLAFPGVWCWTEKTRILGSVENNTGKGGEARNLVWEKDQTCASEAREAILWHNSARPWFQEASLSELVVELGAGVSDLPPTRKNIPPWQYTVRLNMFEPKENPI